MSRTAAINRKTNETEITVELDLDGSGKSEIDSGNGFLDHMLTLFSRHGLFDLKVHCKGDIEVDFHHSVEDIGICMGMALQKALGDCKGIKRYAFSYIPMDESLARVCLDIAGRSNLIYEVSLNDRQIGNFDCDLIEDFFKAFTDHSRCTIHVDLLRGRNSHHAIEAIFKAFGHALSQACSINPRAANRLPSTKGVL